MNFKALSLGLAIGFVLAVVPSCGTPANNCGPNNCTGCCNAGTCVTADKLTDSACGSAGTACSNCAAMSQTCNMSTKSCIGSTTGGGSAAGGSAAGGSTAGGSTAGGSSGGGTAGGSTAGGSSGLMACDLVNSPTCPAGTECLLDNVNGSAGHCVPGQCSVLNQDCTAPNTKCIVGPLPDAGIARQCTPFTLGDGGTVEGGNCTQAISDPCQKGAQCVGVNGGQATCRRFCNPLAGCGPGSECNLGISFAVVQGGQSELHLVCSPITACNPFTQMPCMGTDACQLYRGGSPPGCLPGGNVMGGGTCTTQALCARGFQCIVSGVGAQSGICRAFCNLDGGMPSCAAGQCSDLMGSGYGACSM